jgi:hypothetical protein
MTNSQFSAGNQAELPAIDAEYDPVRAVQWLLTTGLVPTQLVAIHPETKAVDGIWFDGSNPSGAAGWVRSRNCNRNMYFAANPPRPGCGLKPSKAEIEGYR